MFKNKKNIMFVNTGAAERIDRKNIIWQQRTKNWLSAWCHWT